MARISPSQFKNGMSIKHEGRVCIIIDSQHLKMQQRAPTIKTKLKDIRTGQVLEFNFRAGDKFEQAFLEAKKMQFMYKNDDAFVFLDMESYEEVTVPVAVIGDDANFIADGAELQVRMLEGEALGVELPASVVLEIKETEPGIKGDRVAGALKPATMSTGLVVQVPLFVGIGDKIKIGTDERNYISKA